MYGGPEVAVGRAKVTVWTVCLRQHGGTLGGVATLYGSPAPWGTASVSCPLWGVAPVVVTQPEPQEVAVGSVAALQVGVTGSAPLAFAWTRAGAGATVLGTTSTFL